MTIFTDIEAAIEEARFRCKIANQQFAVVQRNNGKMKVLSERWLIKKGNIKSMYSTRLDKHHSVLRG
ncbi:hypothetical protein BB987_09230 [Photorhabdus temperata]|uniref:Uncharacterized protein n=1 Tax=Photorhabdus khanii NC19 TaxID=1004151 RepID=W3V5H5_9GAMM|nr:hypothetical protein PTE_03034 [Photorhabdus khanii NC19]OHV54889.1 hypothetical protein BB987_09230 [Photorhabdus temperata]